MKVVGTLAVFVTVLCYPLVTSSQEPVNWNPHAEIYTFSYPFKADQKICYMNEYGNIWPLSDYKIVLTRGDVVYGWGDGERRVHAFRYCDGTPFVVDDDVKKRITVEEFGKYGITEWGTPLSGPQHHWSPPQSPSRSRSPSPTRQLAKLRISSR